MSRSGPNFVAEVHESSFIVLFEKQQIERDTSVLWRKDSLR